MSGWFCHLLGREEVEGSLAQDKLSDADEVHDLCDAEEGCDDQRSTASALQEGRGPLPLHNLTYAIYDALVALFIGPPAQGLKPGLHHIAWVDRHSGSGSCQTASHEGPVEWCSAIG